MPARTTSAHLGTRTAMMMQSPLQPPLLLPPPLLPPPLPPPADLVMKFASKPMSTIMADWRLAHVA